MELFYSGRRLCTLWLAVCLFFFFFLFFSFYYCSLYICLMSRSAMVGGDLIR